MKKCKVIMLPTTGVSRLWYWEIQKHHAFYIDATAQTKEGKSGHPQHLYLISDDEIKEGNWFYDGDGEICCYTPDYTVDPNKYEDNKKIIASTDRGEIGIDVPAFSEDFIKAYVEANGEIDDVEVEYAEEFLKKYG